MIVNQMDEGGVLRSMWRPIGVVLLILASGVASVKAQRQPLQLDFTAPAESFRPAVEEYRAVWAKEGPRIVAAMEARTGLRFEQGPIEVTVVEATSYSGEPGGRPMIMRASYPEPTKRGTLVHELGHRLAFEISAPFDHHEVINLFVYDVWVELWGQPFADEQVAVESKRNGADYAGMWKKALAMTAAERVKRLQEVITQYRKPRT